MCERIEQLEESAEFDGALISKLQTDAAQVVGKDRLIAELQSQINDSVELVQALERGQETLLKAAKKLAEGNKLMIEALEKIYELDAVRMDEGSVIARNVLDIVNPTDGSK